ncbi:DUF3293 domain-containing protein [Roseomonas sp. PWR1]|uniref:DUF3293 domain-containing protein n=1 Tax=Roseomonas nitratireducens TaxID=2820810 RepID=A0ABS4AQN0_9PROT|nr:DUF3293 domain-containing protein [Neoroseomonas nitratireducens]MBP0463669.1 DUF3293 domain-containing protein [Neoroseomonas nitratireducens]
MRPGLARAWRATLFEADGIAVPIAPDPRLPATWRARGEAVAVLLARLGTRDACFTGAWNPFSRRRPRGWNARMLVRLRGAARRHAVLDGMGRACRPRPWGEEHLLIAASPARCATLARRFRQDSIVALSRRGPARLVVLR